jgi:hypothetical protein
VRVVASPGVDLLTSIGAEQPELLLTGRTLRDQGLMATGLLEAGWPVALLRELITRPLPEPLRLTVGAVIAGRLRAAVAMPVPSLAAAVGGGTVPQQGTAPDAEPWEDGSPTPTPPSWAEREEQHAQLRRGADLHRWCVGDDGLCDTLAVVGETMCAACLGWPLCPGQCTRRTRDGSCCATCQEQAVIASAAAVAAAPTPDGTCPGLDGTPCGRDVVDLGLCLRCRLAVQRDRDRIETEWRATLDQAVAAASASEAHEPTPAPF